MLLKTLQRIILLPILICSLLVSSCGHINNPPPVVQIPQAQITKEQFDCGPASPTLPWDEQLMTWTDRDLFNAYVDAYKWGERCNDLLQQNKVYFQKVLRDRDQNAQPPKKPVDPAP
jgi:hypothetical protein